MPAGEGDTTTNQSVEDQLRELKQAYASQGEILRNVVRQQRNVDGTLFETARKPKKNPGITKEFESLQKMLYEVKKETNELDEGNDKLLRELERFVEGRILKRMEYLYTCDTYGERAAALFLILADQETDNKKLMKLSAEAAKMTAGVQGQSLGRGHGGRGPKRVGQQGGGHPLGQRPVCEHCKKSGHDAEHCCVGC